MAAQSDSMANRTEEIGVSDVSRKHRFDGIDAGFLMLPVEAFLVQILVEMETMTYVQAVLAATAAQVELWGELEQK